MKRGLEVSFAWIFAIIVGAFILFIAVYGAFNFISQGEVQTNTEISAQLVALLSPVETRIESGKYSKIDFNNEIRVTNKCSSLGTFGDQTISTQGRSGFSGGWTESGVPIRMINKYFFSDSIEEGKRLHIFTKPFYAPYKIGDLIIASADNYCFVSAPEDIVDDLKTIGLPHISFTDRISKCVQNERIVCFSGSCEIKVDLARRAVIKDGKIAYYVEDENNAIFYAAIFSDLEIYECQIKRLMKRNAELAELYARKAEFLHGSGCSSNLAQELRSYSNFVGSITGSGALGSVMQEAERLGDENEVLSCRLF